MSKKGLDFKHKEVINIRDGKRMGFVQDVTADLETGTITSIIVPGDSKLLNMFSNANDIVIPWQNIKCIPHTQIKGWRWSLQQLNIAPKALANGKIHEKY